MAPADPREGTDLLPWSALRPKVVRVEQDWGFTIDYVGSQKDPTVKITHNQVLLTYANRVTDVRTTLTVDFGQSTEMLDVVNDIRDLDHWEATASDRATNPHIRQWLMHWVIRMSRTPVVGEHKIWFSLGNEDLIYSRRAPFQPASAIIGWESVVDTLIRGDGDPAYPFNDEERGMPHLMPAEWGFDPAMGSLVARHRHNATYRQFFFMDSGTGKASVDQVLAFSIRHVGSKKRPTVAVKHNSFILTDWTENDPPLDDVRHTQTVSFVQDQKITDVLDLINATPRWTATINPAALDEYGETTWDMRPALRMTARRADVGMISVLLAREVEGHGLPGTIHSMTRGELYTANVVVFNTSIPGVPTQGGRMADPTFRPKRATDCILFDEDEVCGTHVDINRECDEWHYFDITGECQQAGDPDRPIVLGCIYCIEDAGGGPMNQFTCNFMQMTDYLVGGDPTDHAEGCIVNPTLAPPTHRGLKARYGGVKMRPFIAEIATGMERFRHMPLDGKDGVWRTQTGIQSSPENNRDGGFERMYTAPSPAIDVCYCDPELYGGIWVCYWIGNNVGSNGWKVFCATPFAGWKNYKRCEHVWRAWTTLRMPSSRAIAFVDFYLQPDSCVPLMNQYCFGVSESVAHEQFDRWGPARFTEFGAIDGFWRPSEHILWIWVTLDCKVNSNDADGEQSATSNGPGSAYPNHRETVKIINDVLATFNGSVFQMGDHNNHSHTTPFAIEAVLNRWAARKGVWVEPDDPPIDWPVEDQEGTPDSEGKYPPLPIEITSYLTGHKYPASLHIVGYEIVAYFNSERRQMTGAEEDDNLELRKWFRFTATIDVEVRVEVRREEDSDSDTPLKFLNRDDLSDLQFEDPANPGEPHPREFPIVRGLSGNLDNDEDTPKVYGGRVPGAPGYESLGGEFEIDRVLRHKGIVRWRGVRVPFYGILPGAERQGFVRPCDPPAESGNHWEQWCCPTHQTINNSPIYGERNVHKRAPSEVDTNASGDIEEDVDEIQAMQWYQGSIIPMLPGLNGESEGDAYYCNC